MEGAQEEENYRKQKFIHMEPDEVGARTVQEATQIITLHCVLRFSAEGHSFISHFHDNKHSVRQILQIISLTVNRWQGRLLSLIMPHAKDTQEEEGLKATISTISLRHVNNDSSTTSLLHNS
jgi:hypothetical protein